MRDKPEYKLLIHYKKCYYCNTYYKLRNSANRHDELLISTGIVVNKGSPPNRLYIHQCESCGNIEHFTRTYPYVERQK